MGKSTISRSEAGELEILPLLQSFKLDPTAATTSQQNLPHVKEADLDIKELKTIVEEISTRPPLDKRIFGNSQIQHQFPDVFNRNSNSSTMQQRSDETDFGNEVPVFLPEAPSLPSNTKIPTGLLLSFSCSWAPETTAIRTDVDMDMDLDILEDNTTSSPSCSSSTCTTLDMEVDDSIDDRSAAQWPEELELSTDTGAGPSMLSNIGVDAVSPVHNVTFQQMPAVAMHQQDSRSGLDSSFAVDGKELPWM